MKKMNDGKRRARRKTSAEAYLRIARKHWHKHGPPNPSQLAEAAAKVDGMIASLRDKAGEAVALRAKAQRLENKRDEFIFRVAELAALINPKLAKLDDDSSVVVRY